MVLPIPFLWIFFGIPVDYASNADVPHATSSARVIDLREGELLAASFEVGSKVDFRRRARVREFGRRSRRQADVDLQTLTEASLSADRCEDWIRRNHSRSPPVHNGHRARADRCAHDSRPCDLARGWLTAALVLLAIVSSGVLFFDPQALLSAQRRVCHRSRARRSRCCRWISHEWGPRSMQRSLLAPTRGVFAGPLGATRYIEPEGTREFITAVPGAVDALLVLVSADSAQAFFPRRRGLLWSCTMPNSHWEGVSSSSKRSISRRAAERLQA